MTEPIYGTAAERLWNRLPSTYRRNDEIQDWVMKRWLNGPSSLLDDMETLVDRFEYIAPNDRNIRYQATGVSDGYLNTQLVTDIGISTYPEDPTIWGLGTSHDGMPYYYLLHQTDGAYVEYNIYLYGGDYNLSLAYVQEITNGVATVFINGIETGHVVELNGTGNDQAAPIFPFTVNRGYCTIRVQFDTALQSGDNTKLITSGSATISNVKEGYQFSTSDLVNPESADAEWLPWIGQMFGVRVDQSLSVQDQRDLIVDASTGYKAGTKGAVGSAIRSQLTGTKFVTVLDHSTPSNINTASTWDVLVITRTTETPTGLDVPAFITKSGAKPAGIVLHYLPFSASWDEVLSVYPKWSGWESVDWNVLSEAGFI